MQPPRRCIRNVSHLQSIELRRILAKQATRKAQCFILGEVTGFDFFGEDPADHPTRQRTVTVGAFRNYEVTPEGENLVGGHRVDGLVQHAGAGCGRDDVEPAEVQVHVGEILGERQGPPMYG